MLKVGFITTPLFSGHAVRGIGFYTKHLLSHLKNQAKKYDIQIVEDDPTCEVVHYPFFDLFQPTLPLFRPHRTVVTIHDVIPLEFPAHYPPGVRGNLNLWRQQLALQSVDAVVTDSYASVKSIHQYLDVPHHKLKLVYLAAGEQFKAIKNKQELSKVTKKYQLPENFVLYVGDLNYNKNIAKLIHACKRVGLPLVIVGKQALEIASLTEQIPQGPMDTLRRLQGKDHPQLAHLRELRQLFDSEKVYRLGFVPDEDLAAIYSLASVYCQPSLSEGFGLPILEAMACGTQVASSNASSLPEIAGEAAYYFDPANDQEIAAALKKAQNGHLEVVKQAAKFSWEKTADATLQVYTML